MNQEIKRFAIIASEIEYSAWLENCDSSVSSSTMAKLYSIFDADALRDCPYEYIEDKIKSSYLPYKDCEGFEHWLKANMSRFLEKANKDIFSKYGSLSCVVSIKMDYRSGNAEGKKAVGRYWTTLAKLREKFGKHLETVRKTGKMKQKDLDLTKSQISLIENGNSNPTLDSLLLIARGLKKELKFV